MAKLPKTANNVPVVPGMTVWKVSSWGKAEGYREFPVTMTCYEDVTQCYSTREAAEKEG